jgi:phosphate acetyltransferase
MGFIDTIKARAKADKKVIVLPETEDRRTYEATAQILKEGIADVVLVGSEEAIKKGSEGLDISGAQIVDPEKSEKTQAYIDKLVELRSKERYDTGKQKRSCYTQYLYYGVMMVKMGDADGMVSGACHSTADTLRPCLADPEDKTGNKTGIRILPDGSSGLRVWCKRCIRICRFRSEPEPESGRAGCYRSFFRRVLQTAG